MKRKPKYAKPRQKLRISKPVIVLSCIAAALLVLLIVMILLIPEEKPEEVLPTASTEAVVPSTEMETAAPTVEPAAETTEPAPTEPQMLSDMAQLYEENPDVAGWVRIDDTKLDYPVMYTPDEPEKYLRMDFDGHFSVGGLPFLEDGCSLEPESDNLIIYGHNMNNGSMFRAMMSYDNKNFWESHPNIYFSTLYEERTYEIIAAFYDRVYYSHEDVFKFYQFIDAEDEEHFNEAMTYYKEHSLYDTGVTAEYGDKLLTLVTCAYHVDNGRFVLVAREIPDES